jgi:hypothetical protein
MLGTEPDYKSGVGPPVMCPQKQVGGIFCKTRDAIFPEKLFQLRPLRSGSNKLSSRYKGKSTLKRVVQFGQFIIVKRTVSEVRATNPEGSRYLYNVLGAFPAVGLSIDPHNDGSVRDWYVRTAQQVELSGFRQRVRYHFYNPSATCDVVRVRFEVIRD